jgi:hypothetical protein
MRHPEGKKAPEQGAGTGESRAKHRLASERSRSSP